MNAISFDDGVNGLAVFGLDTDNFAPDPLAEANDGTIESVLLILKHGTGVEASPSANLYFTFTDGNGAIGDGQIPDMFLDAGASQCPNCD
jgi:hypothetical protein